jgi:hypothetical protein
MGGGEKNARPVRVGRSGCAVKIEKKPIFSLLR